MGANAPSPRDIFQLGPWPGGINNVAREDSLTPRELREATNVDVVSGGKLETRDGYDRVVVVDGARSLWGDGDYAFYAVGTTLYELLEGADSQPRFTSLHPTNALCYARTGPYTYFSDSVAVRRYSGITQSVLPAAPQAPMTAPTAVSSGVGGLVAGQYMVAITFVRSSGEESVPSETTVVDVAEGEAISLSSIPLPVDADITGRLVYVSDPNEPILYLRRSLPPAATSLSIGRTAPGRALRAEFLSPLPAGHILAFYAGRLWSAVNNVIYGSEPWQYGVSDLLNSSLTYPKKIAMMAPIADGTDLAGMYIASGSRTYFVEGSMPKANRIVYPHGVVPGSMAMVPAASFDPQLQLGTELVPVWLAKNGVMCIGAAGGRVIPITEGRFVTDIYSRAAALYRQTAGAPQYMVSAPAGTASAAAASDVMTVTIVRNGIQDP